MWNMLDHRTLLNFVRNGSGYDIINQSLAVNDQGYEVG